MFRFTPMKGVAIVVVAPCIVIALALWHSRKENVEMRLPEPTSISEMTFMEKALRDPALVEQQVARQPVIEEPSEDYVSPLSGPVADMRMPVSELARPDHAQILRTASQYDSLRDPAVRDSNSPENKALVRSLVAARMARSEGDSGE